jgi:phage minor structural protein
MDLIIMNNQEVVKAVIPQYGNDTRVGFYDSEWEREINGIDTLSFYVTAQLKYKINEGDIVLFQDETLPNKTYFREFRVIFNEGAYTSKGEARFITAESAITELADVIITDSRVINQSARVALTKALEGSRFTAGDVGEFNLGTFNYYYISALEAISDVMRSNFGGGEIDCYTIVSNNKILSRHVSFVQKIGRVTSRRIEVGFNADEIRTTVSMVGVYTALYGRGGSIESENEAGNTVNSRYIDFADVVSANPYKPQGQLWVGDDEALRKYGWKGQHRFGIYQNDKLLSAHDLFNETVEVLQAVNKPTITYEASIVAINNLSKNIDGWQLGDTIVVFNEQLDIATKSRVVKMTIDIGDRSVGSLEIGESSKASSLSSSSVPTTESKLEELAQVVADIDGGGGTGGGLSYEDVWGKDTTMEVGAPTATPLLNAIYVEWDFIFDKRFNNYRLTGVDQNTNIEYVLYEGGSMVFTHNTPIGEVWKYKVQVQNKYGTWGEYSPLSEEATPSYMRGEDMLWNEDTAEKLRELSLQSSILAEGSIVTSMVANGAINWDQLSPAVEVRVVSTENGLSNLTTEIGDMTGIIVEQGASLEDLRTVIGDQEATITTIEGKVGEIDVVKQEIQTANTNITMINGLITDLDVDVSAINQAQASMQTQIQDNASRIANAEEEVDEVISLANGLQIKVGEINNGGFIKDNSMETTRGGWYFASGTTPPEEDKPNKYIITSPEGSSADSYCTHILDTPLTAPTKITFSFDIKQGPNTMLSGVVGKASYYVDSSGTWQETSLTMTVDAIPKDSPFRVGVWYRVSKTIEVPATTKQLKITTWTSSSYEQKYRDFRIDSLGITPQSSVTILRDMIDLRVQKDDVVNSINVSTEGIVISGNKIRISGETTIDNGVIKTAHIGDAQISTAKIANLAVGSAQIASASITSAKIASLAVGTVAIQDGSITNAKIASLAVGSAEIQSASITEAKIANLAVTSAKISSVSADKLTAGTIDANVISVINLNVNDIVGVTSSFIMSKWNGITTSVSITSSGLYTYSGGSTTSILNGNGHHFYRDGTMIGTIGTNNWSGDTTYRGLVFDLENASDYMTWAFQETSTATNYTTRFSWHRTNAKVDYRGFRFDDNVVITSDHTMYIRRFATYGYSANRGLNLFNYATITADTTSDDSAVGWTRASAGGTTILGLNLVGLMYQSASFFVTENSAGTGFVQSATIYNLTASSPAQVGITAGGRLCRITSASKYKIAIDEVDTDFKAILNLKPKSWYDKGDSERYADELTARTMGVEVEFGTDKIIRHYGLIAEDLVGQGLSEFVIKNNEGDIEGIHYDRVWIYTLPILSEHDRDIKKLKEEVAELKAQLNA